MSRRYTACARHARRTLARFPRVAHCLALCSMLASSGCERKPEGAPSSPGSAALSGANPEVVPAPTSRRSQGETPVTPRREREPSAARQPREAFNPLLAPETVAAAEESSERPASLLLEARFVWPTQGASNAFGSLTSEAALQAKRRASAAVQIELQAPGKFRLQTLGSMFSLEPGSTLLGSHLRYGHLLQWPDRKRYRVLSPGSLLAVLREARADVVPLVTAVVEQHRELREQRFGFQIERTLLTTNRGSVTFDRVSVPEAEGAAEPLCRLLLELLAATPTSPTCDESGVVVRAHFEYPGATLDFVVDSLKLNTEGGPNIELPPRGARFVTRELPASSRGLLTQVELRALKSQTQSGLLQITNAEDVAAFVLLDNTPVAVVAPHRRLELGSVPQAEYRVSVRDFLGAELMPTRALSVEDKTRLAWKTEADAGGGSGP